MHTVWVRLNAVVFFSLSVLLVLALLASITSIPSILGDNGNPSHPMEAIVTKVGLNTFRSLRTSGGVDRALFSIDIEADFEPAFHWNVKQLFVFVVAEYETKKNRLNQVVLYDKIIESTDPIKTISVTDSVIKYSLISQHKDLRGRDVELKVYYDTMPITANMYMKTSEVLGRFTLPEEYFNMKEEKKRNTGGGGGGGKGGAERRKKRKREEAK